ncbi:hypothetical protein ACFYY5_01345 [Nocardia elegans]|uniref:Uncharacterized protein n=1 Tax=Nocardia elegans TaxID=300029 RepID=A0ABW6T5P4_9NOCA
MFDYEFDRMQALIPGADAVGFSEESTEVWTRLVEAADAWTAFKDARQHLGRTLANNGYRPNP